MVEPRDPGEGRAEAAAGGEPACRAGWLTLLRNSRCHSLYDAQLSCRHRDDDRQPDRLFNAPLIPGLSYRENLITPAEEHALIARMAAVSVSPFRFQGWEGKRQTASFGWRYDFEDASFGPTEPIPHFLLPLRDKAAAFAGLSAADLVQALIIRYDPGAGIGWHRDRPVFEHVVGVSLGVPATLRFRRRTPSGFERVAMPIAPRSVYHLSGEARHAWEHSIAEMAVQRWSITFRSLSDKMRRVAGVFSENPAA